MKIAVCFKSIADYARLSETDWAWDEQYFIDTGFVRRIFNCYDESALEMALKLSGPLEEEPEKTELTALTVDDASSDLFLRHLMAVGYDHAVRIQCKTDMDLRFNPSAISCLIAAYVRQKGHQLVLTGMQGGEGDNGQTGPWVAERLGWPCIREVTQVVRAKDPDRLKVFSRIDGAALIQTVKMPLVLTIGQALDSPCLRFPSLTQKLNVKKRQVTVLSNIALGVSHEKLIATDKTLMDLERPQADRSCVFLEDQPPPVLARHLYDHYLKNRLAL